MTLTTPLRVGLGLGVAVLAIAGFAAASGQFSGAKPTNQTETVSTTAAGPRSPMDRTEAQIDVHNGTTVTEDYRGSDDQRRDGSSDERGERSEYRVQTRVDNQTGAVQTQDIRRENLNEHGERKERRDSGERDDD